MGKSKEKKAKRRANGTRDAPDWSVLRTATRTRSDYTLSGSEAVVDSGTFNRIGTAISSGIAVGIRSGTGAVVQAARSAARQAYYAARTELNVNSPSKKTREIGESYTEGFALGIERTTPRIVEAAVSTTSG